MVQNRNLISLHSKACIALVPAFLLLWLSVGTSGQEYDSGTISSREGNGRHQRKMMDNCTHIIQSGDTMSKIAAQHGLTLEALLELNPITPAARAANVVIVGDRLNTCMSNKGSQPLHVSKGQPDNCTLYVVQSGDTMSKIAEQYGVSLANLAELNPNIVDVNLIKPGDLVTICKGSNGTMPASPGNCTYIVRLGDTLTAIAGRQNTTVDTLLVLNPNITDKNVINPGEQLAVCDSRTGAAPLYLPPCPKIYIIEKGDTLTTIADKFNTTVEALLAANPKITNRDFIMGGDSICISESNKTAVVGTGGGGKGEASSSTVGIAVGIAAGSAALVTIVLVVWWRHTKLRSSKLAAAQELSSLSSDKALSSTTASSLDDDKVLALVLKSARSEGSFLGGSNRMPSSATSATSGSFIDLKPWLIEFHNLELIKHIGEGSFGRVYLARWRQTSVAVKILMNTALDVCNEEAVAETLTLSNPVLVNLQKEAGLMASLRHPSIVQFLGLCCAPPAVVTDFCSQGSLTEVLRAAKQSPALAAKLDWPRRLRMMLDTAKGMLYLHEHSPPIAHRDLKSPNLLVDGHWCVKISDFNLSKLLEDTTILSSAQTTNPRWLAPEVLAGQPATLHSDVFSFGVVLWEMLTWEVPFASGSPWHLARYVADGGRLAIPERHRLPGKDGAAFEGLEAYIALIHRTWAQIPEDRPSFSEIAATLRELLALAASQRPKGTPQGGGPGPVDNTNTEPPPSLPAEPQLQPISSRTRATTDQ